MSQLIKLQDYISRYERDIYHYSGQYIRLKKQQWGKVKAAWEDGTLETFQSLNQAGPNHNGDLAWLEEDKKSVVDRFKNLFRKKGSNPAGEEAESAGEKGQEEDDQLHEALVFTTMPNSLEDLKLLFLENLFDIQLKWASSTLLGESRVDRKFYYDRTLKYFLQRFPDTYLVMYRPVFLLKKAPVEVDIIMISPVATFCITILEGRNDSVFLGSKERFWTERTPDLDRKILNPLISLNRMGKIVSVIYRNHGIEMPVRKVLLNSNGYFDYPFPPTDIELIEKRNYETWFTGLRSLTSPLKSVQLKAGQTLLSYSQTMYSSRSEWENSVQE